MYAVRTFGRRTRSKTGGAVTGGEAPLGIDRRIWAARACFVLKSRTSCGTLAIVVGGGDGVGVGNILGGRGATYG